MNGHDSSREYAPNELVYAYLGIQKSVFGIGKKPFFFFTPREPWLAEKFTIDWTPNCSFFDDARWFEECEAEFAFKGTVEEAFEILKAAGVQRDEAFEKLCLEDLEDLEEDEDE